MEKFQKSDNAKRLFSTDNVKINIVTISLSSLINRMKHNEIDLNPDFQRNSNLWTNDKMSRLIESILLKFPLPIFYFDVAVPDKWLVVDGLQRLSAIRKFVIDQKLKLNDLEFLELNGKNYDDLERKLKRIIDETNIITYQIDSQTPKEVKYSIFNRINTGGLTLNSQEIRQSLNQSGGAVAFLKNVCDDASFKEIVGMSSKRMADRELVLRFFAFKLTSYDEFNKNSMSDFLDEAMEKLDRIKDDSRLEELKKDLIETLEFTEDVFGEKHKFSRSIAIHGKTKTINRSLFDVITVCFSKVDNKKRFLDNKHIFLNDFKCFLQDERSELSKSIIEGTSSKKSINKRFEIVNELIDKTLR